MHDLLSKRYLMSALATPTGSGGPVDFNATGDKWIVSFPHPVDVYRWGIETIAAMTPGVSGFIATLDKRITIGSDTGRVAAAGGTLTRPQTTGNVPAGNLVAFDVTLKVAASVGSDGSTINVGGAGPLRVTEGQEIVFNVGTAVGAASTGYLWIEYTALPFNKAGSTKFA